MFFFCLFYLVSFFLFLLSWGASIYHLRYHDTGKQKEKELSSPWGYIVRRRKKCHAPDGDASKGAESRAVTRNKFVMHWRKPRPQQRQGARHHFFFFFKEEMYHYNFLYLCVLCTSCHQGYVRFKLCRQKFYFLFSVEKRLNESRYRTRLTSWPDVILFIIYYIISYVPLLASPKKELEVDLKIEWNWIKLVNGRLSFGWLVKSVVKRPSRSSLYLTQQQQF